jgi:glutaredoxin
MIEVLGHSTCPGCKQAAMLLMTKGKSFSYKDAKDPANKELVEELKASGVSEVPQVWINGERVGGLRVLQDMAYRGEL